MDNLKWKQFFIAAADILGEGEMDIEQSVSWCSWTTYDRLKCGDAGYWRGGIPKKSEISDWGIIDSSVWTQAFKFESLAHIIIPAKFCSDMGFVKSQNIKILGATLTELHIPIQSNEILLEIKLY